MKAQPKGAGTVQAIAGDPAQTLLFVRSLKLTDFRNYARAELELDARPVVLVGDNGSGKTNLLEAVSLLGPGHGLRGRPYQELCRRDGGGGFAIAARVVSRHDEVEIGFNARYLLDISSQLESGKAEFQLADPGSPTMVRDGKDAAALYVLMPMRV